MPGAWTRESWTGHEARQQPVYPDAAARDAAVARIAASPALVGIGECDALRLRIAEAQAGRAFLLQGGDCAESFAEHSPAAVLENAALLAGVARRIEAASGLPVIRVGRIAGQFAKPRSREAETRGGSSLPMYRGDIVNGLAFDAEARRPDAQRMLAAYRQAAATLAVLRRGPDHLYTSHEALLLPYEAALVRRDGGRWYSAAAHLPWIGDRTRFAGSAHVELLRGLANPVGIKCGPSLAPALLLRLLDTLNPGREPGRIVLISRMGAEAVAAALPPLLRAVGGAGQPVLWACDPMHGNTIRADNGYKTRPLERLLAEIDGFFAAVRSEGAVPGGLHVEMVGREVTECTGGGTTEADLPRRYETHCDPRLAPAQAMLLAERAAARIAAGA
jgi:3-deoxy-7-phosphoheptulonate synthase